MPRACVRRRPPRPGARTYDVREAQAARHHFGAGAEQVSVDEDVSVVQRGQAAHLLVRLRPAGRRQQRQGRHARLRQRGGRQPAEGGLPSLVHRTLCLNSGVLSALHRAGPGGQGGGRRAVSNLSATFWLCAHCTQAHRAHPGPHLELAGRREGVQTWGRG